MPLAVALAILAVQSLVLAGGLWWTFGRAQLPVGWLSALGLAGVVGVSQALLMAVVQAGIDVADERGPLAGLAADRIHGASLVIAVVAVCGAGPLALKRYLLLDARWTRALSRELAAGFIASSFGAIFVFGIGLLVIGLGVLVMSP